MGKDAISKDQGEDRSAALQLLTPLADVVRGTLMEFVVTVVMEALKKMLEEDRTRLCGRAYDRDREAQGPSRAGSCTSSLVLGGRKVGVRRPRVRDANGEVALPTWQAFAAEDPLRQRVLEQMLIGVATRRYERSLEPVPKTVKQRSTSKSTVSRKFIRETSKTVHKILKRDLRPLTIAAVMLDGIHVGDHVLLVALGIDEQGSKHVLGLREGATENRGVCKALLQDLVERGLDNDKSTLFVIDGSKALRRAVLDVFDKRAVIQRCQVHKRRNVLDHLPEGTKASVGKVLTTTFSTRSFKLAQRQLTTLHRRLETEHPGAAASLMEGFDELLTFKAFELDKTLERSLSTTNPIENLNKTIRRVSKRVTRWRNGAMVVRWAGASLLEAEKGFHRLKGYRSMPRLVAALRARDTSLGADVDEARKSA